MTKVTTLVDDFTSKIRENVKKGEDTTLKTVESWTDTVEGMLPERFTSFDLVERMPKPTEVVEFSFDMAEKVIDLQTEVLKSLAGVIEPVFDNFGGNGNAKKATKATSAKKTTKTAAK